MPWIITTDQVVLTAATISAEEDIITETTSGGGAMERRFPVTYLSAVIIHTPDGQKTPVQNYTLSDPGPYEITWTVDVEIEEECLCVGNIRGTLNTALECPHHAPERQEDQ